MESRYSVGQLKSIIGPIARQYGVQSVFLFGSYAGGSARSDSDVDLKIEKGRLKSLLELSAFRLAVEDALQLPVDLVTTQSVDRDFLREIEKNEVLLYRNA